MDSGCTVTFGGDYGGTYNIPCNAVNSFSDGLYNNSSNGYTIYTNINHGGTSLTCNSMSYPSYRSGQYTYYIQPENVTFNDRAMFYRQTQFFEPVIMFCLLAICILRFMTVFRS